MCYEAIFVLSSDSRISCQENHLISDPSHISWFSAAYLMQSLPFRLLCPAYASCFFYKPLCKPQLSIFTLCVTYWVVFISSLMDALLFTKGIFAAHLLALAFSCEQVKAKCALPLCRLSVKEGGKSSTNYKQVYAYYLCCSPMSSCCLMIM